MAICVFTQEETSSRSTITATIIHDDNHINPKIHEHKIILYSLIFVLFSVSLLFFFVFIAASCERLNNCSGRGNCTVLNFCVCESGSYGLNCSRGEYFRAESVGTR